MGKFIYEEHVRVDFDDRVLAHLQVVIGNKLKRGEPFYFMWRDDISLGGGRTAVWMHAGASFVCKYHGGRPPSLNREWLDALMFTANSPTGLYVVPEPQGATPAAPEFG
jgi:hypothetical protein